MNEAINDYRAGNSFATRRESAGAKHYNTRNRRLFRVFSQLLRLDSANSGILTLFSKRLSLLLIVLIFLSASQPIKGDVESHDGSIETSLTKIIVNPDKYDGKRVSIVAYLRNEFESTTLFISKDDADYRNEENGIWIEIPSSEGKSAAIEKVRKGYVYVEGTFRKALSNKPGFGRGHMGMSQGEIIDVKRLLKVEK